jgi:hypothetical protein
MKFRFRRNEEKSLVFELTLFDTLYLLSVRRSKMLKKFLFNIIKIKHYKKFTSIVEFKDNWDDYCIAMKKHQDKYETKYNFSI